MLNQTNTANPGTPTSPNTGAGVQAIALAPGGTTNIDFSLGDIIVCTFGAGNTTLTFSNIPNGRRITIQFIQDSVGSRTLTWPATAKFATATAPTLSTGASKRDSLTFTGDGTNIYASNAIVLDIR